MAEELIIDRTEEKPEKYKSLVPQLKALVEFESDMTANLANVCAALHQAFSWWWVGFYLVRGEELVLGPFQGPVACTRIKYGKGVCGAAWERGVSLLVPDVNKFFGHIACNNLSVSEIVVPVFDAKGEVVGVLDVDSEQYDVLDEVDVRFLEEIAALITSIHFC